MSHSQEQVAFAHELKQKLAALRPKLDDESLAAQFHRAFAERFPEAPDASEELFAAEFEHVSAVVRVKESEPESEPEKSVESGE